MNHEIHGKHERPRRMKLQSPLSPEVDEVVSRTIGCASLAFVNCVYFVVQIHLVSIVLALSVHRVTSRALTLLDSLPFRFHLLQRGAAEGLAAVGEVALQGGKAIDELFIGAAKGGLGLDAELA